VLWKRAAGISPPPAFIFCYNIWYMIRQEHKEKAYGWFERQAHKPHALFWLLVIAFTESSFFPIPTDPFMAAILLVNRHKWWRYSLYVTIASVLGGVLGYGIGYALYETVGKPIVEFYNLQEEFEHITNLFQEHAFWTIFTAAFTPIPYKMFTIAAGLAQVNLFLFIVASIIGRGLRFFIVAAIMRTLGKQLGNVFFKYFNTITSTIVLLIIIYIAIKILF